MTAAWRSLMMASVLTLADCSCGGSGPTSQDAGGNAPGESCIRAADCASGLLCVNLVCTRALPDSGVPDAARPGGLGDSCVRTQDCREPLRCVQQVCGYVEGDAGVLPGDAGGNTMPDGGDAGSRAQGCQDPGPAPRAVGGCCDTAADCQGGLCIQGACSTPCTLDNACTVTASATPFSASTAFTCAVFPDSPTGRACLPGSLAACTPGTCDPAENCVPVAAGSVDGGTIHTLRCTARRVGGTHINGMCSTGQDCESFSPNVDMCRQGVCRRGCEEDSTCGPGGECLPAGISPAGLCDGTACGAAPGGSDALCPSGNVCIPWTPSSSMPVDWQPQCAPLEGSARPNGSACSTATEQTCRSRLCVSGMCTQLCRSDAECPAAAPFCLESQSASGLAVAACQSLPASIQPCRNETECGLMGCQYVSPRSTFAACTLTALSHASDPLCGANRTCPGTAACLPDDVDGTARCVQLLAAGESCTASGQCRSGTCRDRQGGLDDSARCSSRCRTAADCGAAMECRSQVAPVDAPAAVIQQVCVPITPVEDTCVDDDACLARGRGTRCDDEFSACTTPSGVAGRPCSQDWDCAIGLRCGTPGGLQNVCVRDGCIPGMSNGGCGTAEVCVQTLPGVGECRRGCSITPDCAAVNAALVCVGALPDGTPGDCRLP